jgi:hypothetical protein
MGKIKSLSPALLIIGVLYKEESTRDKAFEIMESLWGKVKIRSIPHDFIHTKYYEKEMGEGLMRQFVLFEKKMEIPSLPEIKIKTNDIETSLSNESSEKRKINIDPGYLTLDKMVLASTKNFSHRIHIGEGIFADLIYRYAGKTYTYCDWTFPEFRAEETVQLFNLWRTELKTSG